MRVYAVIGFGVRKTVAPVTVHDSLGKQHVIPPETKCMIDFPAGFQKRSAWPPRKDVSEQRRAELHHSHAIDFDPQRWVDRSDCDESYYWPFALGFRKCPGKPFAQMQLMGAVATIFKDYNVELAVEESTLAAVNGDRGLAWERTRDEAMRKLEHGVKHNFNLYMAEDLPITVSKRTGDIS
ncbi:hypothetical protein BDV95DRAFT_596876 [Massariosphaeria phaeospora]|uniref:Cytochrome P450 n=1 Tax=Massariosphaeria phaeospora TaxID=100035 RepID=A0A7C8I4N3_9PLEO|nr:hypothetical protein BDV95DRAFT_596876 [Massariosphaeria phaeospora]